VLSAPCSSSPLRSSARGEPSGSLGQFFFCLALFLSHTTCNKVERNTPILLLKKRDIRESWL
jgi:hypothetical protein